MNRLFASEWLKTRRTAVRWLTFLTPVLVALCIICYLASRTDSTEALSFELFFQAWTIFVIPVGAGVMAGFLAQEEALAGSFTGFLSVDLPRAKLYLSKFCLLVFCLSVSTLLATLLLCIGTTAFLPGDGSLPLFFAAAVLVIIGTLPLLALHLWLSFAFGMGSSIGVGIAGVLIAAIMGATSIGNQVWPFVPWTWPVKLSALPSVYLPDADSLPAAAIAAIPRQFAVGLIATGLCLTIFLIGGMLWFRRWEGRTSYE